MRSTVEYLSDSIVIHTHGFLHYLTLGHWCRTCTLDLSQGTLEVTTSRLGKRTAQRHDLREFNAVDYSHKVLGTHRRHGIEYEREEFSVGLRFASRQEILTLGVFQGTIDSLYGASAFLDSLLPSSSDRPNDVRHEVEARSLANMLCEKLHLNLAM